jgi:hypothetical protein
VGKTNSIDRRSRIPPDLMKKEGEALQRAGIVFLSGSRADLFGLAQVGGIGSCSGKAWSFYMKHPPSFLRRNIDHDKIINHFFWKNPKVVPRAGLTKQDNCSRTESCIVFWFRPLRGALASFLTR